MRHANDRLIIKILIVTVTIVGIILFFIGYAKFILTHRMGVIVLCTVMIIITWTIQCYLHIRKRRGEKQNKDLDERK